MPANWQLPADIQALSQRKGMDMRYGSFATDMIGLVAGIDAILSGPEKQLPKVLLRGST